MTIEVQVTRCRPESVRDMRQNMDEKRAHSRVGSVGGDCE